MKNVICVCCLVSTLFFATVAMAEEITIKVGLNPGKDIDQSARLVGQYLEKYLEGSDVQVQNVPGASGLRLYKMMANQYEQDTIGVNFASILLSSLLDPEKVGADLHQMQWIGSLNDMQLTCMVGKESGIETVDDFLTKPFKVGATTTTAGIYQYAALVKNLFSAQYEIVTGYKGSSDIMAGISRGEVDGVCGRSLNNYFNAIETGEYRLIAMGNKEVVVDQEVIPSFKARIEDEKDLKAYELSLMRSQVHYIYFMSPQTPQQEIALYRKAFADIVADPDFKKDAAKIFRGEINPTSGQDVETKVNAMFSANPETVSHLQKLMQ